MGVIFNDTEFARPAGSFRMRKVRPVFVYAALGALGFWLWSRSTQGEEMVDNIINASADSEDAAQRNIGAFLQVIRFAEGTAGPNGYITMFGGRLFSGFADHPRVANRFTDKLGRLLWTSAAGAYQFMAVSPIPTGGFTRVNTWDRVKAELGLIDFSPFSQDRAALFLIKEEGALDDVREGRFAVAVDKVRNVWASLPGAGYNQPEKSLASLQARFVASGGEILA